MVLVPNPTYWDASRTPLVDKVVMVPQTDSDTEINALLSGQVDMIFPQPSAGTDQRLADSNIDFTFGFGTNYENLWIQQNRLDRSPIRSCVRRSSARSTPRRSSTPSTSRSPPRPRRTSAWCGCPRSAPGATPA